MLVQYASMTLSILLSFSNACKSSLGAGTTSAGFLSVFTKGMRKVEIINKIYLLSLSSRIPANFAAPSTIAAWGSWYTYVFRRGLKASPLAVHFPQPAKELGCLTDRNMVREDFKTQLPIKDLRGNPKTRVSTDRTETSPGSGHVCENILGLGRTGDKDCCPVQVGVFFTRVYFYLRISKIKWN